jgi:hypothetical protein
MIACNQNSAASPSPAALSCKLPAISAADMARGDNPAGGGFIRFPGGSFTPDPRAAAAGVGRPVYDAVIGDWLPKPKGDRLAGIALAPDGLSYVQEIAKDAPPNPNGPPSPPTSVAFHVINVRTGSDRVVYESGFPYYEVLGYSPPAIFLTPACWECGAGGSTLWSLDERSGSLRKVSDLSSYWKIAGGKAWGGVTTDSAVMDRFVSVDMTSGTVITWLRKPGAYLRLLAIDSSGSPLVRVQGSNSAAEAVWHVTQPEKGEEAFRVPSGGLSGAFTDRNGTWIGGAQLGDGAGIFLYTASGLRKMSDFPGVPLGGCG